MRLNTIKPDEGSKKNARRVGRGHTRGKTCGRGHKGQKSRSGGKVHASFEGGQMPLQRRLPKTGFVARSSLSHEEVPLYKIASIIKRHALKDVKVDFTFLQKHGIIKSSTKTVKLILSGELTTAVSVHGLPATKGVVALLEKLGGSFNKELVSV